MLSYYGYFQTQVTHMWRDDEFQQSPTGHQGQRWLAWDLAAHVMQFLFQSIRWANFLQDGWPGDTEDLNEFIVWPLSAVVTVTTVNWKWCKSPNREEGGGIRGWYAEPSHWDVSTFFRIANPIKSALAVDNNPLVQTKESWKNLHWWQDSIASFISFQLAVWSWNKVDEPACLWGTK